MTDEPIDTDQLIAAYLDAVTLCREGLKFTLDRAWYEEWLEKYEDIRLATERKER